MHPLYVRTLLAGALAAAIVAAPGFAGAQGTAPTAVGTAASGGGALDRHASREAASADSVEQRIDDLHRELEITPSEEAAWTAVAQTMRENADAMEKLADEKTAQSGSGMTAVDDLRTYGAFAAAHVEHLKKLTSVFETLYNAMPDQQKKLADAVFARSRHDAQHAG